MSVLLCDGQIGCDVTQLVLLSTITNKEVSEYIPLLHLAEETPGRSLPKNARWISWLYLLALREAVNREMLHIKRFFACENELGHPATHYRREFEAVTTERKLLFKMDSMSRS